MPHVTLLHKIGEVKENPIALDRNAAKQISDGLIILLASCSTLFHQLKKHHWVVKGPNYRDLHLLLDENATNLLKVVDQLAERITVLGAYPISTPRKQQEMTVFHVEEEGVFELRMMLANDIRAYQQIIIRYRDLILRTQQYADYSTEGMLKDQLQQIEMDVHHIEHVLSEDTLSFH